MLETLLLMVTGRLRRKTTIICVPRWFSGRGKARWAATFRIREDFRTPDAGRDRRQAGKRGRQPGRLFRYRTEFFNEDGGQVRGRFTFLVRAVQMSVKGDRDSLKELGTYVQYNVRGANAAPKPESILGAGTG